MKNKISKIFLCFLSACFAVFALCVCSFAVSDSSNSANSSMNYWSKKCTYNVSGNELSDLKEYLVFLIYDSTADKYYFNPRAYWMGFYSAGSSCMTAFHTYSDYNILLTGTEQISSCSVTSSFTNFAFSYNSNDEIQLVCDISYSIMANGSVLKSSESKQLSSIALNDFNLYDVNCKKFYPTSEMLDDEIYACLKVFSSSSEAESYISVLKSGDFSSFPDFSHSGGAGVVRSSSSAIILTGTQSAADKTNGGSLKTSGSWLTNPDSYGKISILLDDDFNYHDYYIRVSECSAINSIVRNQIENSNAYLSYQERTYSGTGVEWLDCLSDICTIALKNISLWDESVNSAMKNVWSDIEESILDEYCYHMNDIVFSLKSSITSDSLCFKSSDLPYCPTRVLSFSLLDYFSIVADSTYKIEVVDGVTGRVLDYTYLLAFKTVSNKTSDYFGFKVYKYSDYDTAYNDVINDTPVNYHTLSQSDKGTINSNYNPFTGNISYGGSDVSGSSFSSIIADSNSLSNFTGSIDSALNGVGYFFDLCYGILPPVYLSIIATAAVGLVILRILGR